MCSKVWIFLANLADMISRIVKIGVFGCAGLVIWTHWTYVCKEGRLVYDRLALRGANCCPFRANLPWVMLVYSYFQVCILIVFKIYRW